MHRKKIGLLWVICITSGAMIGSGLFVLPGPASKELGSLVFIPYLLAGLLFIPALLCTCELATAMPKTGGIFYFSDRSMGPRVGMLGGIAFWFSIAAKTAWALLGLAMFFTLLDPYMPVYQIKMIAIGACAVFMVLNLLHIEVAGRIQQYMALGLLGLLVLYILAGLFFFKPSNLTQSDNVSVLPILTTTSLVFISFSGITWITDMGGEIKNPSRNIPMGIILSWAGVTILYVASVLVTAGLLGRADLSGSVTPLSDGGRVMFGAFGMVVMTVAGLLAFLTTGNAGMLTASRTPYAMSKDRFLPPIFSRNSRKGVPAVGVVATAIFMVLILFLPFEAFVRTASSIELITLVLACLAVLFMREANIKNYRPTFKVPLYPALPILGLLIYGGLVLSQGWEPVLIIIIMIAGTLVFYQFYSRSRIKVDYAALHIVKNITGIKNNDHKLNEELREIIIERDGISEHRFESLLGSTPIIKMDDFSGTRKDLKELSERLSGLFEMDRTYLARRLRAMFSKNDLIAIPGIMLVPVRTTIERPYKLVVVRTNGHPRLDNQGIPLSYIFIVRWSGGMKNFYLHSIMWLVQLGERLLEAERDGSMVDNRSEDRGLLWAWHTKSSRDHYIKPTRFQLDEDPYGAIKEHHLRSGWVPIAPEQ